MPAPPLSTSAKIILTCLLVTSGTLGVSVPGTLLLLSPPSQPASTPAAATARAAAPALLRKRRREIISSLIIKNLHIVLEVFPRSHFLPSGRKANLCSDSLYPPPPLYLSRGFSIFVAAFCIKNRPSFLRFTQNTTVCVLNAQAPSASCISQLCRFDRHYF